MKGYVIDAGGEPVMFGHRAAGSKVDRLANLPGHSFVPSGDARADALRAAMTPPDPTPDPDNVSTAVLVRALKAKGVISAGDLQ